MSQFFTCSQCKEKKFANTKVAESRLKKFGSLEEIEKNWVCRRCLGRKEEQEKE